MPLDISPENFGEHPLISALRLTIAEPNDENKKLLLSCISSETQNTSLDRIAEIIKNSDINKTQASELLVSCGVSELVEGKDNIDSVIKGVIEAYLNILVRLLK